MRGWIGDIGRIARDNDAFRRVVWTGTHVQLTAMRLQPGENIGLEAHPHLDQFLRIEEGRVRVDLGPEEDQIEEHHELDAGAAFVVPAGTWHDVVNVGTSDVTLSSLYSPPEHPDGAIHRTKEQAEEAEAAHEATDGTSTSP